MPALNLSHVVERVCHVVCVFVYILFGVRGFVVVVCVCV